MISPTHQRAIAAAIPDGVKVPDEFWRALDTAISLYQTLHERRAAKPPRSERERFARIEKLANSLAGELRKLRLELSWEHDDPMWPNRALRALWEVTQQAEANRIGHEMRGALFNRRTNPHRDMLYAAICNLWTIHLQRKLTYSPNGPVVRFFEACLAPVLNTDMPTDRAIRDIIARHKAI